MSSADRRHEEANRQAGGVLTQLPGKTHLADAATELLNCQSADDVYRVAADFISRVCPGSLVIVNEKVPGDDYFTTRRLVGLDDSLMARAVKLVGFQIIGKRSIISPRYRDAMTHARLSRIEGGFAEFASSEVSPIVGRIATKLAGIRDVYTIGIASGESCLGNIHICTRIPGEVVPAPTVERFVRHAYAALEALATVRDLKEVSKRLRLAVGTSTDGFWAFDADGRLIDVNPAYCRMSGFTKSELIGTSIVDLTVGETPEGLADRLSKIITRQHDTFDAVHRRRDGRLYDVELSVSYLPTHEGEFTCFIRDVTERKQIEETVRRLNAQLEERVRERTEELSAANNELRLANAELAKATRAKNDFLASMSHELRTPLNSIIGFSGIMLQGMAGPLTPEQERQLRMVSQSGRHLLSLINDVLDLAKIEAGRIEPHVEPLELSALADSVMAMIQPLATSRGIELALSCAAGSGVRMLSDPRIISQMLINLLNNAVKFTDTGSVSLGVSVSGQDAIFEVADTGRGISPKDLPHIMDSFYQAEGQGNDAKTPGTGLGLAITSRQAESLGGTLSVESELGVGSTFTLRVPGVVAE